MRISSLSLSLLALTSLSACTGKDVDDSAPAGPVDSDGDGLSDDEEEALGTDPNSADSDADGFDDSAEVDAGTDPLVCWSLPEGWAECSSLSAGVSGEGWDMGAIVPSFPMTDQFGDEIESWRFYGMITVLDISAGWCGPCRAAAPEAQASYEELKDEGVTFIQLMIDDNSNDGKITDSGFTQSWVDDYGITFPVTTDESFEYDGKFYNTAYAEMSISDVYNGGIPFFAVLDRHHRIVDVGNSAEQAKAKVEALLAAEQ